MMGELEAPKYKVFVGQGYQKMQGLAGKEFMLCCIISMLYQKQRSLQMLLNLGITPCLNRKLSSWEVM